MCCTTSFGEVQCEERQRRPPLASFTRDFDSVGQSLRANFLFTSSSFCQAIVMASPRVSRLVTSFGMAWVHVLPSPWSHRLPDHVKNTCHENSSAKKLVASRWEHRCANAAETKHSAPLLPLSEFFPDKSFHLVSESTYDWWSRDVTVTRRTSIAVPRRSNSFFCTPLNRVINIDGRLRGRREYVWRVRSALASETRKVCILARASPYSANFHRYVLQSLNRMPDGRRQQGRSLGTPI